MIEKLYNDAKLLIDRVIQENMPQEAVRNALKNHIFSGNIHLVAIGKAAWTMAHSAHEELGGKIKCGIVITKYGHSLGEIPGMEIIEAGHPLSDENTITGTKKRQHLQKVWGQKTNFYSLYRAAVLPFLNSRWMV
jgi:hydroxypyruvate reductase